MQNDLQKQYNNICDLIAVQFGDKYFDGDADWYWIGDDRNGGVLYVNDMFFSLEDMLNFMKYKYTADQMFRHYYYRLDCYENGNENPICIRDWKKLK